MTRLPDLPRWTIANGIAGDANHREAHGLLVHPPSKLAVAIADDAELATIDPSFTLLTASEAVAARSSRTITRVILQTTPDPEAVPDLEGATLLPDDVALPLELPRTTQIWCAYVDGEPVAFAYAPWRTPRYFDLSVDVLTSARQLGLGTLVASAAIHAERAHGRSPVWGSGETDAASLRLAKRLGFEPIDQLWMCT